MTSRSIRFLYSEASLTSWTRFWISSSVAAMRVLTSLCCLCKSLQGSRASVRFHRASLAFGWAGSWGSGLARASTATQPSGADALPTPSHVKACGDGASSWRYSVAARMADAVPPCVGQATRGASDARGVNSSKPLCCDDGMSSDKLATLLSGCGCVGGDAGRTENMPGSRRGWLDDKTMPLRPALRVLHVTAGRE
jgi:hypothetical protein